MKRTTINILAILLLTIIACKNDDKRQDIDANQSPMNDELSNTTNYKESGNFDKDQYDIEKETDSVDENWNLDSPERKQNLYTRFNMNDDQIERYEQSLKDWRMEDTKNSYEKLSVDERMEKENTMMKDILDENQYKQYRTWSNNQVQR